jgi:hypothetical protein
MTLIIKKWSLFLISRKTQPAIRKKPTWENIENHPSRRMNFIPHFSKN